jgi:hypothetical protein
MNSNPELESKTRILMAPLTNMQMQKETVVSKLAHRQLNEM